MTDPAAHTFGPRRIAIPVRARTRRAWRGFKSGHYQGLGNGMEVDPSGMEGLGNARWIHPGWKQCQTRVLGEASAEA
jgi:hypothetical protein